MVCGSKLTVAEGLFNRRFLFAKRHQKGCVKCAKANANAVLGGHGRGKFQLPF